MAKRDVPASLPFRPPDCAAETARPHGCVRLPTAWGEMSALELAPTQPEILTALGDLPGGSRDTRAIAFGDVNGDGHLDAVVGNDGAANQLLIGDGNGAFAAQDLPGGRRATTRSPSET